MAWRRPKPGGNASYLQVVDDAHPLTDQLRVNLAHAIGTAGAHTQAQQNDESLEYELPAGPQDLLWIRRWHHTAAATAADAAPSEHSPAQPCNITSSTRRDHHSSSSALSAQLCRQTVIVLWRR